MLIPAEGSVEPTFGFQVREQLTLVVNIPNFFQSTNKVWLFIKDIVVTNSIKITFLLGL